MLDDWLAKRQQMSAAGSTNQPSPVAQPVAQQHPPRHSTPAPSSLPPVNKTASATPVRPPVASGHSSVPASPIAPAQAMSDSKQPVSPDKLHLRGEHASRDDEVSIKIR